MVNPLKISCADILKINNTTTRKHILKKKIYSIKEKNLQFAIFWCNLICEKGILFHVDKFEKSLLKN